MPVRFDVLLAPLILACVAVEPAQAGSYTYTPIDLPGAYATFPAALNNDGQVVGSFNTAARETYGFVWQAGIATVINGPANAGAVLLGINGRGLAVGSYAGPDQGLVYDITTGSARTLANGFATTLVGINNHGTILANTYFGENASAALVAKRVFAPLVPPGFTGSRGIAINDSGLVLGEAGSTGFLYRNGSYELLPQPFPQASPAYDYVHYTGLSETGVVVGFAERRVRPHQDLRKVGDDGFVFEDGAFDVVRVPGAVLTDPHAIQPNSTPGHRTVAGQYAPEGVGGLHAFIRREGHFYTIDYPGAAITDVVAVNDSWTLLGTFERAPTYLPHAFIATCAADQQPCTR